MLNSSYLETGSFPCAEVEPLRTVARWLVWTSGSLSVMFFVTQRAIKFARSTLIQLADWDVVQHTLAGHLMIPVGRSGLGLEIARVDTDVDNTACQDWIETQLLGLFHKLLTFCTRVHEELGRLNACDRCQ